MDLRDSTVPSRTITATLQRFGPHIDILVNNAGYDLYISTESLTPADFAWVYDLNVLAPLLMYQAVAPYLRTPGRIINIGSIAGRSGQEHGSLQCSSKAALESLTRCWAVELGPQGHTVNTVCPGPSSTDWQGLWVERIEEAKKNTPVVNPLCPMLGGADDISHVVAWLAGEGSRWITGQTISASGGYRMY